MRILVLRPEPGASETAARARTMGLDPVVAPLFTMKAVEWEAPDPSLYDAVLLTSANAARNGGEGLAALTSLPCYAVGEATAAAARAAGFADPVAGSGDGAAAVERMAAAGAKRALHLCALDHIALEHPQVTIERQIVYAAEPVAALPPEARGEAIALIHSPRAGRLFAELIADRGEVTIAAISANAADAAGGGWRSKAVVDAPRDQALLELAARLCNIAPPDESGSRPLSMEFEPPQTALAKPRRSLTSLLLLTLVAFIAGIAAACWLLSRWDAGARYLGIAAEAPAVQQAPPMTMEQEPDPPMIVPQDGRQPPADPEMIRRLSRLEVQLAQLDAQSRTAVGNADRAEGLLVAFAARRALDRGVALGYIEGLLRQRFAATQPQAVGTIITAARQPVTLQELQDELLAIGSTLTGVGPDQGWWDAFKTEMAGLVTVRRTGSPSTMAPERLRRAQRRLEAGQVEVTLAEVLRLPGRQNAEAWVAKARRYIAARRALDAIETAALIEPHTSVQAQRPAQVAPARPALPL